MHHHFQLLCYSFHQHYSVKFNHILQNIDFFRTPVADTSGSGRFFFCKDVGQNSNIKMAVETAGHSTATAGVLVVNIH